MRMLIRALKVKQLSDGLFSITLPSRELSITEHQVLDELFPNLGHRVRELLDREAMLDAIVGPDFENEDRDDKPVGKKVKQPMRQDAWPNEGEMPRSHE